MKTVFLSYRQTSAAERDRVRTFGRRLRQHQINVVLDQFLLEEKPEGPSDGWAKWSSDRALETEYVIIIGGESWFQCFDKKQLPGTGLGAACEADDLRMRIYDAGGIVDKIRVVLFDDSDASHVPGKLRQDHRFHADRDFFGIVQWLGGNPPSSGSSVLKTSTPNNLPRLQPFFGREKELATIRAALDPSSRTWGALIDGPGGMGKTSLAVRAAYDCPPDLFQRIVFVSVKDREMDTGGYRSLGSLLVPGFLEMLNELARELGQPDIAKSPENQRIRLLLDALRSAQALLILDNLESLPKSDCDQLVTFINRLPQGCKAILTSRQRIGSGSEELVLEKLDQDSALATISDLARGNAQLARSSEAERVALYNQTAGNPLLLRWVAGQLGRGSCTTSTHALAFLRSCPPDNDPLEFIFGDLARDFTADEEKVLCALTYFGLPAKVEHVAAITGFDERSADTALRTLSNRSLVVPDQDAKHYTLVPTVGDFLRRARHEVVASVGRQLVQCAQMRINANGGKRYERFPVLEDSWPIIAAAIPLFMQESNQQLQSLWKAAKTFLRFSGRWDEALAFVRKAETEAAAVGDSENAGRRALEGCLFHEERGLGTEILACVARAHRHWDGKHMGASDRAELLRWRGCGQRISGQYSAAVIDLRQAVELWRTHNPDEGDMARVLNALAVAEHLSGDLVAAEAHYREALGVARSAFSYEPTAEVTGDFADLLLDRGDWSGAESLARTALPLAEEIGRQKLVAANCHRLAKALVRQGRAAAALPYARRAVEIYGHLSLPALESAQATLVECC